jgi:hypothetical protein
LCVLHLPFGQHHELVENPGFLPVVSTVAAPLVPTAIVTVALVTVTRVTAIVVLFLFELRQLVAEEAHPVRVTVVVRLTNGLADLTLEPRVESTVDLPLSMSVTVGSGLLPTLGDSNDLLEVLPLTEVPAPRVIRRPGRLVNRPA